MIEVLKLNYPYAYKPGQRWSMELQVRNGYDETVDIGLFLVNRETDQQMGSLTFKEVAPGESKPSIWTSIIEWEGEVPLALIYGKLENDKLVDAKEVDFTVREGSFTTGLVYEGLPWWAWASSGYECVIVLFGGGGTAENHPYVWINPLYRDDWQKAYSVEKERFIINLQRSGFHIFSNQRVFMYNSTSSWLESFIRHLKEDLGFDKVHLFGFSAGGTTVAYEVQKPYASELIDSAVIASAIVDWPPGYADPVFYSSKTAQNLQTRLYIIAPVEDELSYDWLLEYYENAEQSGKYIKLVEWTDGHDIFKNPSLDGHHLLEVALECYKSESQ